MLPVGIGLILGVEDLGVIDSVWSKSPGVVSRCWGRATNFLITVFTS